MIPVQLLAQVPAIHKEPVGDVALQLSGSQYLRQGPGGLPPPDLELKAAVAARQYREDLYFRLSVFPITIPPLRERADDITTLARFFIERFCRDLNKKALALSEAAEDELRAYPWPGNVRELENFIERAVILSSGSDLRVPLTELKAAMSPPSNGSLKTLEDAEREHILKALREAKWTIGGSAGAAAKLGMKRTTLQSKMQKLGIVRPQ